MNALSQDKLIASHQFVHWQNGKVKLQNLVFFFINNKTKTFTLENTTAGHPFTKTTQCEIIETIFNCVIPKERQKTRDKGISR